MSEMYEVTRDILINASPETVYSYLTEEEKMKEWFGEVVESVARPGGKFLVGKLDGTECRGEYVEVIPNKKVVFTWGGIEDLPPGDSKVEIILKADGQATHLTLRHYNIRLKPSADSFGQGWKEHAFPLLKDVCEGRKPDGLCFETGHECKSD